MTVNWIARRPVRLTLESWPFQYAGILLMDSRLFCIWIPTWPTQQQCEIWRLVWSGFRRMHWHARCWHGAASPRCHWRCCSLRRHYTRFLKFVIKIHVFPKKLLSDEKWGKQSQAVKNMHPFIVQPPPPPWFARLSNEFGGKFSV